MFSRDSVLLRNRQPAIRERRCCTLSHLGSTSYNTKTGCDILERRCWNAVSPERSRNEVAKSAALVETVRSTTFFGAARELFARQSRVRKAGKQREDELGMLLLERNEWNSRLADSMDSQRE
jgi:hypothetical protein